MSHVFTGTASGHTDLLNKIVAHLTDGANMGAEVWQLLTSRNVAGEEERYLKAPGLAGTDEIYINITTLSNVGADRYNFRIRGAIAHNPAFTFNLQPGTSPDAFLLLWQNSIPYTLVASGRRFILVAKVSTVYSNAYAGFLIPYSTSAEYPYPLFVGGSAYSDLRWSQTGYLIGSPWDPSGPSSSPIFTQSSSWLRHYDGVWNPFQNYYDSSGSRGGPEGGSLNYNVWPWQFSDVFQAQNFNGEYSLLQSIVNSSYNNGNLYGELQGVFFITGFGNAVENTITIAGKTYLVTQNMARTGRNDYAAILLE
jgi:hypothetical protein